MNNVKTGNTKQFIAPVDAIGTCRKLRNLVARFRLKNDILKILMLQINPLLKTTGKDLSFFAETLNITKSGSLQPA